MFHQAPHLSSAKNYELAFYAPVPETLKVADKPPLLGGTIQDISVEEFCKTEGFTYTSGIQVECALRDRLWHEDPYQKAADDNVEYIMSHPRQDLVIAQMDRGVGKGVFLALNAQPIPKNTVVMIYEGILDSYARGVIEGSDYLLGFGYKVANNIMQDHFKLGYAIYAAKVGGIARFVQSGIDEQELSQATGLTEEEKKHIPTANLVQLSNVHMGCPVVFLSTTREILPGEHLVYAYSGGYWNERNAQGFPQKIFDVKGAVIGEKLGNNITLYDRPLLRTLPIKERLNLDDIKTWWNPIPPEGFNYKTNFLHHLQYAISIYLNRNKNNKPVSDFLENLQSAADNQSSNNAYLAVQKILEDKDSYKAFFPEIRLLKKEIIWATNIYNHFVTVEMKNSAAKEPSAELKK